MKNKRIRETFNDGRLTYGYNSTVRSDTGKRIGEKFKAKGQLFYNEMSARDSDYQMANFFSANLDLKVKTPYPPSFHSIKKSKLKVVINNLLFDVIKVDSDKDKNYLYFYLQEVGALERQD